MKPKYLSLAVLSLTALKTATEKQTILAQTPENNPSNKSPKQNQEDITSKPIPTVSPPEIIPNCEFKPPKDKKHISVTNSNPEANQDTIPPEIPSYCESKPENPEPNTSQESTPEKDPNYIIPPQIVAPEKVNPLTTTIPLNGNVITNRTEWETNDGYTFGENRSSNLDVNGILRITSEVEQQLTNDNVFTSDQRGSYLQLQTVKTHREIELTQTDPQTLQGLIIQESFTGNCFDQNPQTSNPNDQCTFTPALVTDRNSIDPVYFIPTRIDQFGNIGDAISPETLAILAQPGFQNRGVNGEVVGLDLYFPNLGATPGNTQGNRSTISRSENIDTSLLLGYSRVRQILKANDTESVLGRTIRGTGVIIGDDNTLLNGAVSLAAELLPDANPHLEGSPNPVNTNINRHLFEAANNARLPDNSWTVYQGGIGKAKHAETNTEGEVNLPSASYNSLWLGLSPVTERDRAATIQYQELGPERIIASGGGEGGANDNVSFVSNANGEEINSANLQDFYTQIYLTFLNRDVNFITKDKLTEDTTYYPHLSLTGDITSTNQLFRYYTGIITSDPIKAYIGGDYSRRFNNLVFNINAIGYLNPDRDYFSYVQTSLARGFRLSKNANITLSTGLRYAFKQTADPLDTPIDNSVSVGARANIGNFSLGLTQYFGNILPDSINTALGVDASLRLGTQGKITAYLSPSNNQLSYGAIGEYKFGSSPNSPALVLGWRRDHYDFGEDAFGDSLETGNDIFTILFRIGAPSNPLKLGNGE
ncbi:hypothetical protein [Limnofasciculus baicalensis]|uniref:Uncharacterized protein n=1 Tax=Limnofasciculus baicalensis BBK-W-15 TaxID=2699891 RepID=A0AAE3GMQ7_9CYAN|nr:hypothetical protein [Limnofasciculus baicalensis]MCP2727460.1 hypothetical protein [Limnofasciculus baicalensis BBK-W-15]